MHLLLLLLMLHFYGGRAAVLSPIPSPPASAGNMTLEYIDPTLPPLLPGQAPKCSLTVLRHDFAHTVGHPPVTAAYTPPTDCQAPWSRIVLELTGTASDVQQDRIAAVWINGAEILRTSTPYSLAPGVFWQVRKDITRYSSLLRAATTLDGSDTAFSMMLENSNETFSGVFSITLSLQFYRGALCEGGGHEQNSDDPKLKLPNEEKKLGCNRLSSHPTIKGLYREPADMIIPISNELGDCGPGYWYKVHNESDVQGTPIQIPRNSYRAVLEIYASYHADDEYWYANPLRSTDSVVSTTSTLSSSKANGGFRQLVVSIDRKYAGAVVPFPVIYPGSINPFFWAPVAAIGAYDHPSYDMDLTPFLGYLVDGREHDFGLTVRESQPYWLLSGNLHLWLDPWSDVVEAALVRYKVPPVRMTKQADWRDKTGKSSVDGQVIERFSGWVSSSKGNITTAVRQRLKFKSRVVVQAKGSITQVQMEVKQRTNVRIEKNHAVIGRVSVSTEAPLFIETIQSNGGGGSEFEKTKVAHSLEQTTNVALNKETPAVTTVADRQDSEGSVLREGGVAAWGSGDTKSTYKYRDNRACYLRTMIMVGGRLKDDVESASCVSFLDS